MMRALAVVAAVLAAVLAAVFGGAGGDSSVSGYCLGAQCFAVFRDPSGFADAERSCAAHGGSPMTVRSSVAHDALSILLGGSPGRYWIGLHRPLGCPDPAADLRGYQWVTADTESDFHNWAPNFDSDCASPRCVSVSEQDQFKWAQEPCAERAEGFLCEYSFSEPCKGFEVADGEYVTYTTRLGFEGTDLLSAPPGTTAVRMPAEISYICFDQRWLQAPWACEILGGGCEYECAVDPDNQPFCHCPPGRSVNPDNRVTCELDLTDPCARLRCQHACYRDEGAHACTCNQGFKLEADGRACADVDECADPRQCPGEHFVCLNSEGAFECVCERGYVSSGALCVDEDECVSAPCEHECANTPGGYNCSCYQGYKADPDEPEKCVLHCGAVECPAECDPNDRYQCFCPDGYIAEERGAQVVCIDIDECAFFYCDQKCRNTFGGYVCSCAPGFKLVDVYRCERDGSGLTEAPEGGSGGGAGTSTSPPAPTEKAAPGPTGRPSAVTPGGLVGIIVCTVFVVVLVVLIAHHVLCRRPRTDSKAPEETLNL